MSPFFQLFNIKASVQALPGECDKNFHLHAEDGTEYLLKISASDSDDTVIDLQNAVLNFLAEQKLSFRIPTLLDSGHTPAQERVRLFPFLQGTLLGSLKSHSKELIYNIGLGLGELDRHLSTFHHPAACRDLKWDILKASWIRNDLHLIENSSKRKMIEDILHDYETRLMPILHTLRKSVIHGDVNDYNILVSNDAPNELAGFIDFGDLHESVTIAELAIAATYIMMNKVDPLDTMSQLLRGYQKTFALSETEIEVLLPLIKIRLCTSVVNSARQKVLKPDDPYVVISEKPAWDLLQKLDVKERRKKYIGKNVGLSYKEPLHIVRGKQQYLYDQNGRQYLDAVNNVCHVGHCHPRVVEAGQTQIALLNTNTRYLHENLNNYAERLIATLPKPLEVCFFVCSGSEANELALRLAFTHTQRKDVIVVDAAYHGNTNLMVDISPYKFNGAGGRGKADFVHIMDLPDSLRGKDRNYADQIHDILNTVKNPAAFICESLLSCGGQIVLPDGYLQNIYTAVREAGGVCIADEVQVGLGRIGTHFWAFESQGVVPDIITIGKPLGNGHPMAAVVTTREIADSFANGMEYFNTFGGNPVSCAIGLSVLDVIADERLQEHALDLGNYLKSELLKCKTQHSVIGDVRGLGLFLGIELVSDSALTPSESHASFIVERMKERGILLSTDGLFHNVIKIKPPMVFNRQDADFLVDQFKQVLRELPAER